MIKLSFSLNGRTIPAAGIAAKIAKQVTKSATRLAAHQIALIRCPVHYQNARITPGLNGQYRIDGCCEQLIRAVRRQLR